MSGGPFQASAGKGCDATWRIGGKKGLVCWDTIILGWVEKLCCKLLGWKACICSQARGRGYKRFAFGCPVVIKWAGVEDQFP